MKKQAIQLTATLASAIAFYVYSSGSNASTPIGDCGVDGIECSAGESGIFFGDDTGGDSGSCRFECLPDGAPPPNPTLNCVRDGMTHSCAVWPRSAHFQYHWAHTPGISLSIPTPTDLAYQEINCHFEGHGKVQVTIVSKSGEKSWASFPILCMSPEVFEIPIPPPSPDPLL